MPNFIPQGTAGSRLSFLYKCQELLRQEHNTHSLGEAFRIKRADLDGRLPQSIKDKRVKWLYTFWNKLPITFSPTQTQAMKETYEAWKAFDDYVRTDYGPRSREVVKEIEKAKVACDGDDFSTHPELSDPTTSNAFSGILSKTFILTGNEGTNIARARRFLYNHKHLPEEDKYIQAAYAALGESKRQCFEGVFHSPDIGKIKVGVPLPELPDPLEDFTTYFKYDLTAILAVLSNKITFTNLSRAISTYMTRDFGLNGIGDVDHLGSFNISAMDTSSLVCPWALANLQADIFVLRNTDDVLSSHVLKSATLGPGYSIFEHYGGALMGSDSYYSAALVGTQHWTQHIKDNGVLYGNLFTDVDMTVQVAALSVTLTHPEVLFEYFYPIASNNSGTANLCSGFVENYDLQLAGISSSVVFNCFERGFNNFKQFKGKNTVI